MSGLPHLEGEVHEGTKISLIFKGTKTSDLVNTVLRELNQLRTPHTKYWSRRHNEKLNFDNQQSIAFLCDRNNAALFAFGTHNKKRPHNLVMGRCFNGAVLDMMELGIEKHAPVNNAELGKARLGSKPLVVFLGAQWGMSTALQRLQNLFLDFFHGVEMDAINLEGIDRVVGITALPPTGQQPKDATAAAEQGIGHRIHLAHYAVSIGKGKGGAEVTLSPTGPTLTTVVRRTLLAPADVFKNACKRPRQQTGKGGLAKNVSKDELGNTLGQIHVQKQELAGLHTKKFRANRVARKRRRGEEGGEEATEAPKAAKKAKAAAAE